jgi:hypothetical protein
VAGEPGLFVVLVGESMGQQLAHGAAAHTPTRSFPPLSLPPPCYHYLVAVLDDLDHAAEHARGLLLAAYSIKAGGGLVGRLAGGG